VLTSASHQPRVRRHGRCGRRAAGRDHSRHRALRLLPRHPRRSHRRSGPLDPGRFDRALAAFPADSRARADQLKRAWDNFTDEIHHHHTYEEALFWPAYQELGIDTSLLADLDGEHDAMRQALEVASGAMGEFHGSAHHHSPTMKVVLAKVQKAHKGRMGNFFAWLQDGAAPHDKAGLRKEIPAPVVFVITAAAGRLYRREIGSVWA
jgi:hypothetical protein